MGYGINRTASNRRLFDSSYTSDSRRKSSGLFVGLVVESDSSRRDVHTWEPHTVTSSLMCARLGERYAHESMNGIARVRDGSSVRDAS